MSRVLASEVSAKAGQEVVMMGWVHARRDHGKIIFIDLRDRSGLTQVVFAPGNDEVYNLAQTLRSEYVVQITGNVSKRPEKMLNEKIISGDVELQATGLVVLNEAKTPPFELDKDTLSIDEELRMKYRYLDLRAQRMLKNVQMKAKVISFCRDYYVKNGFTEVETPMLTKGTPEGAREYVVPARLQKGKYYVLPQSPQQFKQLLMVAGVERYMQIARCFRDEDSRGDRQPEFTQLDVEMSFADEVEIRAILEGCITDMVKELYPEKHITKTPFPVLTYAEAMEKYKSDKPDLRENKEDANELAFVWIVDFPLFEYSATDKKLTSTHHPFTRPATEDIEKLDSKPEDVKAVAYDLALNGFEVAGGSVRIHERALQEKIFEILGLAVEDIEARFGHMLKAFEYGAPPMGGLAVGMDRLVAILQNEGSIREVIAFPKTGDGRDLMMEAPSEITDAQKKELGIKNI